MTSSATERRLPAEAGLWAFVIGDMLLFGVLFNVHAFQRRQHLEQFRAAQGALDAHFGLANTLLLLTSSWCVALALRSVRRRRRQAVAWIASAMGCGVAFCALKAVEYTREVRLGFTPTTNEFYMSYYMLTGLHLLHVVVGIGVLLVLALIAQGASGSAQDLRAFESGAVY
jgi:nitric oxide reductase NorE protein